MSTKQLFSSADEADDGEWLRKYRLSSSELRFFSIP